MKTNEERQLVELLKLGDQTAVQVWFKSYRAQVFRFIHTKIENRPDVEELTQQTFLNCLKNLPLYLGNASLVTWMLAIAKHEVADYFRKKYAKRALKTFPLSELLLAQPISDAHETSARVARTLKKMTAYSRELLLQKYIDCKKVGELAEELGKSVKAVESELFRARKEFKVLYLLEE